MTYQLSGPTPDPLRAVVGLPPGLPPSGLTAPADAGKPARLAARGSGLDARFDQLDRPPVRVVPSGS